MIRRIVGSGGCLLHVSSTRIAASKLVLRVVVLQRFELPLHIASLDLKSKLGQFLRQRVVLDLLVLPRVLPIDFLHLLLVVLRHHLLIVSGRVHFVPLFPAAQTTVDDFTAHVIVIGEPATHLFLAERRRCEGVPAERPLGDFCTTGTLVLRSSVARATVL